MTIKFDNSLVDCAKINLSLIDWDDQTKYCADENSKFSIGVNLCQSIYQVTSSLKYDNTTKKLQRFINAIEIIPEDN